MVDDGKLRATILRVLREHHRNAPNANEPLDVDSLSVIALVDALESEHNLRFKPSDVRAESFASLDALIAVCRQRA